MTAALEEMELTSAQGHLIGYLTHCAEPPCQKDIEERFHLSHPTVSGVLSRLEKKEFIELCTDIHDRRRKRIHVLPKGEEYYEKVSQTIREIEERIVKDFTPEEQAQFMAFLERAILNMGESPCHHQHKEEPNE